MSNKNKPESKTKSRINEILRNIFGWVRPGDIFLAKLSAKEHNNNILKIEYSS